jgi:hypothetical protein
MVRLASHMSNEELGMLRDVNDDLILVGFGCLISKVSCSCFAISFSFRALRSIPLILTLNAFDCELNGTCAFKQPLASYSVFSTNSYIVVLFNEYLITFRGI